MNAVTPIAITTAEAIGATACATAWARYLQRETSAIVVFACPEGEPVMEGDKLFKALRDELSPLINGLDAANRPTLENDNVWLALTLTKRLLAQLIEGAPVTDAALHAALHAVKAAFDLDKTL